ncbi:MAG: dephospho-CoA kinase, partial [bacterium]|nr:dephospho-CoA kinase [bacterium]
KTTVAELFKVDKFGVINTDLIAAELRIDPEFKKKLVELLGDSVLEDDEISKEKLLEAILSDELRPKINAIFHPAILARVNEKLKKLNHDGVFDIVIDAPIFKQLGLLPLVEVLIYVKSNLGNRILRIKKRKNYVEETISKLILIQSGEEDLEKTASFVIENNGTENELKEKVYEIINKIRNIRG